MHSIGARRGLPERHRVPGSAGYVPSADIEVPMGHQVSDGTSSSVARTTLVRCLGQRPVTLLQLLGSYNTMLWNAVFGLGFAMDAWTFALARDRDVDRSSRSFARSTLHVEQDGRGVGIVCERQQKMLRCPLALMVIPRDARATQRGRFPQRCDQTGER
jgi:hypothetical protein